MIVNPNFARVFFQSAFPWTDQVPAVTSADGLQVMTDGFTFGAETNRLDSRVLSGSQGKAIARRGRRQGTFSAEVPLQGAAVGTLPDNDALLTALFGGPPTATAGTDVKYVIQENVRALFGWIFRDPVGAYIWDEVLVGAIASGFEFRGGGAEVEASLVVTGPNVDVLGKPEFASLTTLEKRGLVTFPVEPAAATFTGKPALGFTGSVNINSVGSFQIESFRVFGDFGRTLRFAHGNYYPTVPISNMRSIGVEFRVYEEDTEAQGILRHVARTVTPYPMDIVIGEDPGNIYTLALKNVAGGSANRESSGPESLLSFAGSAALSPGAKTDEFALTIT